MSFRRYIYLLFLLGVVSCDSVVDKSTAPPNDDGVPQAVVEVIRVSNPGMADVLLSRVSKDVWQADFPVATHRSFMLIDNEGEILFENKLVGSPQSLPQVVKDEVYRIVPEGFIEEAAVILQNLQTKIGHLVEVEQKDGLRRRLRFNANNALESDTTADITGRVMALFLTTVEQLKNDTRIPSVVKQFFETHNYASANVSVYVYEDKTTRIIVTNTVRDKNSLITTEVLLDANGQIKEWIMPLEKEIGYEIATQNETPSQLSEGLASQTTNWTWNYSVREKQFGKINKWKMRATNTLQETFWMSLDVRVNQLSTTKASYITAAELPASARQYIDSKWSNWQWAKGRKLQVIGEPKPTKYVAEIRVNGEDNVVVFDGGGQWIFQYKKM